MLSLYVEVGQNFRDNYVNKLMAIDINVWIIFLYLFGLIDRVNRLYDCRYGWPEVNYRSLRWAFMHLGY